MDELEPLSVIKRVPPVSFHLLIDIIIIIIIIDDLYSSPNIVRLVKSRRMRWAGHVARMEERECVHMVWWGNLRERGHWGDQDVDGRIMLGWIFRKWEGVVGNGWRWLRIGTGGGRL